MARARIRPDALLRQWRRVYLLSLAAGLATSWNGALYLRTLAVSTPEYWTTYVLGAFQAEDDEDCDPELTGTKGISTHIEWFGYVPTKSIFGSAYTGMCAVFQETLDDAYGSYAEQLTVAHEIAHTLGVDHGTFLMHPTQQVAPFSPVSLVELRSYNGP